MKGDLLKYRIPGNLPQEKQGRFVSIADMDDIEGFIICPFNTDRAYLFVEGPEQAQTYYGINNSRSYDLKIFQQAGEAYLDAFRSGIIKKGVLSRPLLVEGAVDPGEIYNKLLEAYPNAFVYLVSSPLFGTWIGASPEILLHSEGNRKYTVALAGTRSLMESDEWNNKELAEHRYVVEHIDEIISGFSSDEVIVKGPDSVQAGAVKHLKTNFEFKSDVPDNIIINKLQPTPAIAGTPVQEAIELIRQKEGYDRELYTGYIGIIGKDSSVYVNLRCMQVFESEYVLYLGGGWTIDSDPQKEFIETENKAATLLQVINKK